MEGRALYATQQELADVFGVSVRTIQRWGGKGLDAHRAGPAATYHVPGAVQWRRALDLAETQEAIERMAPSDIQQSRARKLAAEARLTELELAAKEGNLITLEVFEQVVGDLCDRVRARMLNMPGKYGPLIVGLSDARRGVHALDDAVRDVLGDLNTRLPQEIEAEAEANYFRDEGGP